MRKLSLLFVAFLCLTFYSCKDDPTCFDGEQNQAETGIDCGGECTPCVTEATCSDGIQNGNETGVDCGGADCSPCATTATCSDGIQNGNETGVDCGGPDCNPCGGTGGANTFSYTINGTGYAGDVVSPSTPAGNLSIAVNTIVPSAVLTLVQDNSLFTPGAYSLSTLTVLNFSEGGLEYNSGLAGSTGTVTFTQFTTNQVSGSISATLFSGTGASVDVTATFTEIDY